CPLFLVIGPLLGSVATFNPGALLPPPAGPETNRALRQPVACASPRPRRRRWGAMPRRPRRRPPSASTHTSGPAVPARRSRWRRSRLVSRWAQEATKLVIAVLHSTGPIGCVRAGDEVYAQGQQIGLTSLGPSALGLQDGDHSRRQGARPGGIGIEKDAGQCR